MSNNLRDYVNHLSIDNIIQITIDYEEFEKHGVMNPDAYFREVLKNHHASIGLGGGGYDGFGMWSMLLASEAYRVLARKWMALDPARNGRSRATWSLTGNLSGSI